MKENWMKKLIDLLKLREESKWEINDEWCLVREEWVVKKLNVDLIISKKYWFIRDLVKADRIDLLKLTCMNPQYTEILDSDFSWEDRIIMILSIEENPISFLISVLK